MNPLSLLSPDRSEPAVLQVVGISGSGKTTYLNEMIRRVELSESLTKHQRIVIFDVKHDGYTDRAEPVSDYRSAVKSIRKNRITLVHPSIEEARPILDDLINHLFELSERIEEFSATLIIEESSTFIKSTVNGVPPSIKRMATQGRGCDLKLILCNQRSINSKWTDTQTSRLIMFRLPMPDLYLTERRWAVDAKEVDNRLKENKYSFAVYDLEKLEISYYNPLHIQPTP